MSAWFDGYNTAMLNRYPEYMEVDEFSNPYVEGTEVHQEWHDGFMTGNDHSKLPEGDFVGVALAN